MPTTHTAGKPSAVSRALARDRLGVPAVLFFVLSGVAPLTVAAGVIPTAYATTGLTAIPAAFLVVAVILDFFASGYVAMTRHITNAGAFYKRTCSREHVSGDAGDSHVPGWAVTPPGSRPGECQ